MSVTVECLALKNPNPRSILLSNRAKATSLRCESFVRSNNISVTVRPSGFSLFPLHHHGFRNLSVFAFSASHEEELENHVDEDKSDLKVGNEESEEAWEQSTLASFKERTLKMQSVLQEAYELYSKKAIVILKETSEQLEIQAEKARHDLSVVAKEISEEGKEYMATAVENSPEPVKDIVDTFVTFGSSVGDDTKFSEVLDFYLGIPYGIILSFGGFLSFLLTGSIPAIRFGVILGGTLLALSISSLRSWKRGEPYSVALKGQTAISGILFLREIRLLFERPPAAGFFTVFISGAMLVFYMYRIAMDDGGGGGQKTASSNLERGTDN